MIATEDAVHGPRGVHPDAPVHRVLIVDDEERIRHVLRRILHGPTIVADTAANGADALAMTMSGSYDLVILDLLMPEQDGFSTLRAIMRRRPDQAVLVLSCLTDPESKMASFGLGADDYVPKPFHVGELLARVQARLRAGTRPGPPTLRCGRLTLDLLSREADAGHGPVPLTSREFQLLCELMRRPGGVVAKDELLARVWSSPPDSVSNVVDAYVGRLRSRLGPGVITTVRGKGYCVGPG
jgi:two-component system, OmpR family, response regulator